MCTSDSWPINYTLEEEAATGPGGGVCPHRATAEKVHPADVLALERGDRANMSPKPGPARRFPRLPSQEASPLLGSELLLEANKAMRHLFAWTESHWGKSGDGSPGQHPEHLLHSGADRPPMTTEGNTLHHGLLLPEGAARSSPTPSPEAKPTESTVGEASRARQPRLRVVKLSYFSGVVWCCQWGSEEEKPHKLQPQMACCICLGGPNTHCVLLEGQAVCARFRSV